MTSEARLTGRFEVNEPHVVAENVDGEVVVVDLRSGYYFSLTGSAALIWNALAAGAALSETAQAVRVSYENPGADLETVLKAFADQLLQEGLLRESKRSVSAFSLPHGAARVPYYPPVFEKFTDMKEFLLVDPIHEVNVRGWPHKTEDPPPGSSPKDGQK